MIWLGEAALDQGRPDAAEPLFTKALSLQPRSVAAHYGLGRAALARKDYARAAQHLEQALALDGKASVIHYSLAMAYRGLGDQSAGGVAPAATRHAADSADDPLMKGARRAAQQRADLREERRRRWQQRRVGRGGGVSQEGAWPWPRRGRRRVTSWVRRSSTWATGAARRRAFQEAVRLSPELRRRALRPWRDLRGGRRASAGDRVLLGRGRIRARLCRRASRAGQRVETKWTARTIAVGVRAHLEDRSRRRRGAFRLRGGARPPQPISDARNWLTEAMASVSE